MFCCKIRTINKDYYSIYAIDENAIRDIFAQEFITIEQRDNNFILLPKNQILSVFVEFIEGEISDGE